MTNPIQKALAKAEAIIAQDVALDKVLNTPAPVAPTFAELSESTLDDLTQVLDDNVLQLATISRTDSGDVILFTASALYYIAGTHISIRDFHGEPRTFNIEATLKAINEGGSK